ncbi:DDE_3 domain-containing protein [Trichonephila clavipes]|nr:DDE_3 domain-containing protein [Trichonephila clavipes]
MRGTLTGQRYVDDILQPHVGPFLKGLPGAIFEQDNARPHTVRVAQDFLRHFQTLPPDLFPVEHVWNQLKRQIPSCHSVHDLELAVQDLLGPSVSGQHKGMEECCSCPPQSVPSMLYSNGLQAVFHGTLEFHEAYPGVPRITVNNRIERIG